MEALYVSVNISPSHFPADTREKTPSTFPVDT